MTVTTEIAPDVFRISAFVPRANLQFNHFLIRDEEPMLFHTGLRGLHADILDAVTALLPPGDLRRIAFSHFESDECGSLNEWLALAPNARAVCSQAGSLVSVNDFIGRPAEGLADAQTFSTGRYRFRFCPVHRICPTAGTPACSTRRRTARSCARTCSIRTATSRR